MVETPQVLLASLLASLTSRGDAPSIRDQLAENRETHRSAYSEQRYDAGLAVVVGASNVIALFQKMNREYIA